MSPLIRNIHRALGFLIIEAADCEKPVWWNYWDYCPRNEKDYMTRVNYLLYNPVKHGYVKNLHDYPFSSFHRLYDETGREQLAEQFRKNPGYKNLVLHEANDDDY